MLSINTTNLDPLFTSVFTYRTNEDKWIDACCYQATKRILQLMNSTSQTILTLLQATLDAHDTILQTKKELTSSNSSKFTDFIETYIQARSYDNASQSTIISSEYPQPNPVFTVETNTFASASYITDRWSPLNYNGVTKAFLTPEWGKVSGVFEIDTIQAAVQAMVPIADQWETELDETEALRSTIDDTKKTIAEFWAGGPGSSTPPGIWNVLTGAVMTATPNFIYQQLIIYHKVNAALFQAGIICWRLKRVNMQARPIQKIRLQSDATWLPYQPSTFITPPFPDFCSGHSSFSVAASTILNAELGTDVVPNVTIAADRLRLISPIFSITGASGATKSVIINPRTFQPAGTSTYDPNCAVILSWNSFADMAQQAGISRLYGGIHVQSANVAGLNLGYLVGTAINKLL
jgi:hypothetical protein